MCPGPQTLLLSLIHLSFFQVLVLATKFGTVDASTECFPIQEPTCLGMEYKLTYLPNVVGFSNQMESSRRLRDYTPLLKLGCSSYLEFFLCSVYFPMCTESLEVKVFLRPCASFCHYVKQKCVAVMQSFNFPWPEELDCSKLPSDDEICIRPRSFDSDNAIQTRHGANNATCVGKASCKVDCTQNSLYNPAEKGLAGVLMRIMVSINLCFSITSLVIALSDRSRFPYPNCPLIFLSVVCILQPAAYIIQLTFRGQELGCAGLGETSIACRAQFFVAYYSQLSTGLWYVVVGFCWYVSASKGWAPEAIEALGRWFHLLGWVVPCFPPIAILLLKQIDADGLLDTCYTGNENELMHLLFVVFPEAASTLVGFILLALTLSSLILTRSGLKTFSRIPNSVAVETTTSLVNVRRFSKTISRAVLITICLTTPLLTGLACDLVKFFNTRPLNAGVRMTKACADQAIGIATGIALWVNWKTLKSIWDLSSIIRRKSPGNRNGAIPQSDSKGKRLQNILFESFPKELHLIITIINNNQLITIT